MTISPTSALMACADLSAGADPNRPICHVCIEVIDDALTIFATDGNVALHFVFKVWDFPASHWVRQVAGSWQAPGRSFPKWGEKHWNVDFVDGTLTLVAKSKKGKRASKQPDPVVLTPGVTDGLKLWSSLRKLASPVKVDLSNGALRSCLAPLDADAVVRLWSDGEVTHAWAGTVDGACFNYRWKTEICTRALKTSPRVVNVGLLWDALETLEPSTLVVSATDELAPLILLAGPHTALVMPLAE